MHERTFTMANKIRVTIWNEFRHEKHEGSLAQKYYPNGIHAQIKSFLDECDDLEVRLACLDDPDQGIPDEVLDNTDVLMWWGHCYHDAVRDDRVEYIRNRVYKGGMGFVACHSAHESKPFKAIVGTSGALSWGDDYPEIMWNLKPSHPIAEGIPDHFDLELEELYAEPFYIPDPDDLIFAGWYPTGHIFRAGATYTRGMGRVFYFQPGHESCPSFHNPFVQRVLKNGVHWVAPTKPGYEVPQACPYIKPIYGEWPENND